MLVNTRRLDVVARNILDKKVLSFDDVSQLVECSEITLRRDLKKLNALTSFTHRGKFITLPDIPSFDERGLWFYRQIGFSKFGTSLDTIIGLIEQSKSGLSREEMEAILKIGISKQIQILIQRDKLQRIKLGSRYLYIPESVLKNKEKKLKLLGDRQSEEHVEKDVQKSDLIALLKAVLVEKKVGTGIESLKHIAMKYFLKIPIIRIQQLIVKHDLSKKKRYKVSD